MRLRVSIGCAWLALFAAGCGVETVAASDEGSKEAVPFLRRSPSIPTGARLRVAVVSDLNGRYGSADYDEPVHAAIDRVLAIHPDLVLSTGDMVAGQRSGLDYPAMWRGFHAAVSDRLRAEGIPFAVTPGNHDGSSYTGFESERAQFVDEWNARRPDVEMVDDTQYPLRYTFRRGPAFFVSLDATAVGPLDAEQMRWLDRQLASSDLPVKIVFGHLPLYGFSEGRQLETLGDPALESLLRRHRVALFVSGHHHAFYPGRRGPLRLVSMSCLGGGPRSLLGTEDVSERSIVVFEVTERGIETLDGWAGESFDEPVARVTLPPSVGEGGSRIDRDDIGIPPLEMTLTLR